MNKSARISQDGQYRYSLGRTWNEVVANPRLDLWVMLNPSTADADLDDPTIRRCIGFSKGWGADGIRVVNLFALRATHPRALLSHRDPIGPDNDAAITLGGDLCKSTGGRIIAGWGAHAMAERRAQQVHRWLGMLRLQCLGVTKSGAPKHPLYVKADVEPMVWWGQ